MTKCPYCEVKAEDADMAIHLTDIHGWTVEQAETWLRFAVEEKAFWSAA